MATMRQGRVATTVVLYSLVVLTASLLIAATASTRWVVSSKVGSSLGLWQFCADGSCAAIPDYLLEQSDSYEATNYKAARACSILSILAVVLGVLFCVGGEFAEPSRLFVNLPLVLFIISGAFAAATGVAFDLATDRSLNFRYSTGFILIWIAVGAAVGTGAASFLHFRFMLSHHEREQRGLNYPSLTTSAVPMATTSQHPYSAFSNGAPGMAQPMTSSGQAMTSTGQSQLVTVNGQQMMMQAPPGCNLVYQSPAPGAEPQWVAVPIPNPGPIADSAAAVPTTEVPAPVETQITSFS